MRVASLTESPAERVSLLHTALSLLDRAIDVLPAPWADAVRRTALKRIDDERRIDAEYAKVRTETLEAATRLAERADVRGLERLRRELPGPGSALATERSGEMAALGATVAAQLEAARRLRLARDQYELRLAGQQAYERQLGRSLDTLVTAARSLEAIRAMAGPAPRTLRRLSERLRRETPRFDRVTPPAELQPVHALFRSAWELAVNAVRLRLDAATRNSLDEARRASAAAAGALLLLGRAQADLETAASPPTLSSLLR
jgi:hypothetical protein